MADKTLTVAVIGGGIGRAHVEEGYEVNPDRFKVVAICDTDTTRRDAFAEQFSIERRVTTLAEVLAMQDVDIVDICTPPFLHYDQIRLALAAGKHVICEKPLVGSLREIDALAEMARTSRGRLMPIFQSRFGDGVQQVRRLIDAGLCGELYLATAQTCWQRGPAYYSVPWRGKWETELGGTLLSHAIHTHDVLTYLAGPIARLSGSVATRVNPIETEDCFSVSGMLANGAPVSLTGTLGGRYEFTRLYFAFANVTVESDCHPYDYFREPWKIVSANEAVREAVTTALSDWRPVAPGFATQFRLLYEAITMDRPLPVTIEDSRRALELAKAVYHSNKTRREVALPLLSNEEGYPGWMH